MLVEHRIVTKFNSKVLVSAKVVLFWTSKRGVYKNDGWIGCKPQHWGNKESKRGCLEMRGIGKSGGEQQQKILEPKYDLVRTGERGCKREEEILYGE